MIINKTTLDGILFLVKYKAAHRLSAETLRRVLGDKIFDIGKLINDPKKPNDKEGQKPRRSEMKAAAANSQLFDYMMRADTAYDYITTGRTFLFLRVKEHESATAYCYLAVPNEDVNEDADEVDVSYSSISQVLCHAFLAFESRAQHQ